MRVFLFLVLVGKGLKKEKKLKKVLDKLKRFVIHSSTLLQRKTMRLQQMVFENKGKGKKNSQSAKALVRK